MGCLMINCGKANLKDLTRIRDDPSAQISKLLPRVNIKLIALIGITSFETLLVLALRWKILSVLTLSFLWTCLKYRWALEAIDKSPCHPSNRK
mmetsp:Transcript_15766/g.24272  ORF Transcript_15766/g.24272 Transcript_15766/m.24272 type:complete len:93 (-) Transcript_15766:22-300(-)